MGLKKIFFIFLAIAFLLSTSVLKESPVEATERSKKIKYENLEEYFKGTDGTFVLYNLKHQQYKIYNPKESVKRVSPYSTFKVVNSLIGLETGVVYDENTVFQWDGTPSGIPGCDQDQTLASAIRNSCVWCYQEIASEVGEEPYQYYLHNISYGNGDISGGLTTFWLGSSLKISALEQVNILKKLYTNHLPFSQRSLNITKKIIKLDESNRAVLSGKTGGAGKWFIGYVETGKNTYIFATSIPAGENGAAYNVTLDILKDKKIYY